jgi:four helix bundle protein
LKPPRRRQRPEAGSRRTEDGGRKSEVRRQSAEAGGQSEFSDHFERQLTELEVEGQIMGQQLLSFRELRVYQRAFALQQDIFQVSKEWPKAEAYALTDQVRRSSRAVGANIAESWAKRAYPSHFVSKLTDADGELQETVHWLATACACNYIGALQFAELQANVEEIGKCSGGCCRCR